MEEYYKCHHVTIYKHSEGNMGIACYAGSFGEPMDTLQIFFREPDKSGLIHEAGRHMSLEEAIQFANEIIRRAKIQKELIRRFVKDGTPANEPLDPSVEEENPYRKGWFDGNERAERFSDLWFSQRKTATIEQRDKVGLVYISKVLGLGDEIARKFASGDTRAYHKVGMKQSNTAEWTINVPEFWKEIREIFPNVYTDEDIEFLVKEGKGGLVMHFLKQIDFYHSPFAEESPILRAIGINAHAYK